MATQHVTFCRICEALCGLVVTVDEGRVLRVKGDDDHIRSSGYCCPKGAAMGSILHDPDRVRTPLRRCGAPGEFEPVTWEEALDDIARRLRAVLADVGPEAVAMYFGNPAAFSSSHMFWAKGFMDAIGSPHFYSANAQDGMSRQLASLLLYGSPYLIPIPDVPATSFLLVVGANPLVSHGSALTLPRIGDELRSIVARGGRVLVVDPVATKTAKAFEHVPIRPGGDAWLLAAMLHTLFAEELIDRERLTATASGVEDLERALAAFPPERAVVHTGLEADAIRVLARDFATADRAVAYGRVGICRGRFPTLTNVLLDSLNVVTDNFDRRGGALFGWAPVDLAALGERFGMATFGAHRTRVGDLPDIGGHLPYVLPQEITTPGPGRVRALFLSAGNPVLSAPDGAGLERAFAQLDLLVSLDLYVTESNRHADYVLPAPTFLERDDALFTFAANAPRPWLQTTTRVVAPEGDVREEWVVYDELARRLGRGAASGSRLVRLLGRVGLRLTPARMLDLMLRTSSSGDRFGLRRGGLSLAELARHPHGVATRDDVPVGDAPRRIRHDRGRVQLADERVLDELGRLVKDGPVEGYPLRLVGRRELRRINSWFDNLARRRIDAPSLYVHPHDAGRAGFADGDRVRVESSAGAIEVPVHVTADVVPGAVCYPHGWGHDGPAGWRTAVRAGGANVNLLAPNDVADKEPLSGMSWLDGIPVRVMPSGLKK